MYQKSPKIDTSLEYIFIIHLSEVVHVLNPNFDVFFELIVIHLFLVNYFQYPLIIEFEEIEQG